MSEHEWCHDNLTLYAAGGLAADECARFERHAAECAACAKELAQWRLFDQGLDRLCAPVHFAADWDGRVVEKWHATLKPRRPWSAPLRWAAAVAAIVLVGLVGAGVMMVAEQGLLAFPGGETVRAEGPQMAMLIDDSRSMEAADAVGRESDGTQAVNNLKQVALAGQLRTRISAQDIYNINTFSPGNFVSGLSSTGNVGLGTGTMARYERADKSVIHYEGKPVSGAPYIQADPLSNRIIVKGTHWQTKDVKDAIEMLRKTQAGEPVSEGGTVALGGLITRHTDAEMDERIADLLGRHPAKFGLYSGKPASASPPAAVAEPQPADKREAKPTDGQKPAGEAPRHGTSNTVALLKSNTEYHKLHVNGDVDASKLKVSDASAGVKMLEQKREIVSEKRKETDNIVRRPQTGEPDAKQEPAAQQPKPDPQIAQRKIIRTGELEFEVDVFDDTVERISKLIGAIPGAFVATVNSEKLPNGKVRGSVVVRVPPEHLDKFVLDLRKDLAKTGELKSQKIGSSDVTKQYTDIESRLRAARAMEERLINIIKTGKGEIKDLVAAERELGVWRTKIEEYEGEIRYYNNQVGLSTLTITAYEKEIRAAAAMVITEQVTMKIEADDVEKSLGAALAAVAEAKGRVTKSDLKQSTAGQLEAVVQFEVAPAAAGRVKEKLKQLGIVTHHDSQRLQKAEGGTGTAAEIKSRQSDVQFNVTLYNVANIQPRETFVLQIAVQDVPADYGKMLEAVTKAMGQIRVSQLNEQEKLNIFAQLDFDVPSGQRAAIDKQLSALGDMVSKNTTRAGPGETATDRKVGYKLVLKSVTSILPRETIGLGLEVKDVEKAAATLADLVRNAKGRVTLSRTEQDAKGQAIAIQWFDVPLAAKDDLVQKFKLLGTVRAQRASENVEAPATKMATAHIDVTLTNVTPIVPADEGLWPQVRSSLGYAFRLLSLSLMFLIVGVAVLLPWALILWAGFKLIRRMRGKSQAAA